MGLLVFPYRHQVGLAEGDIRRLADGITQKAVGHIVIAIIGRLGLNGGIMPQAVYRNQHGIENRQLPNGGDAALLHQRDLIGVQTNGQVIHRHLVDAVLQQLGVLKVGGQGLDISQQNKALVLILQSYAVLQATHIVAQVQLAGGTVTGQDSLLFGHGGSSPLIFKWFCPLS